MTTDAVKATGVTFTTWEKLVNPLAPFAVPALVAISPAFKAIYKLKDKMGKSACVPEASNKYTPIVVFSSRTVQDLSEYKKEFASYANAAQETKGCRMCFSFVDRDKENTVLQCSWFDSAKSFAPQPKSLVSCYSETEDDYTAVFGEYNSEVQAAIQKAGGKCNFNDGMSGYMKDPKVASDFKTGELPMIWLSKRKIKEGCIDHAAASFQKGVSRMYWNAPTAIAIAEFKIPNEKDTLWSLRLFNSFDGFKRHFPVPSAILFRMVMNVVPSWEAFPIGFSFSTKETIEGAISANPGNKAYKQYYYDDGIIGPQPDFGKGF